ncbi:MAG TPA: hypothetical protein VEI03_02990 [Stellaceae bacterium]|nr:hypothetical protein [Stellaceae bacterium]
MQLAFALALAAWFALGEAAWTSAMAILAFRLAARLSPPSS